MSEKQKKVIRDGKVAVLYSPGFGAGWSSWNTECEEWCLFSPEVVAWVEGGKKGDIEQIVKDAGYDFYTGGADDLEIEWMPEGTLFIVEEYDGSESITINRGDYWRIA